jgi:hypothetical protein
MHRGKRLRNLTRKRDMRPQRLEVWSKSGGEQTEFQCLGKCARSGRRLTGSRTNQPGPSPVFERIEGELQRIPAKLAGAPHGSGHMLCNPEQVLYARFGDGAHKDKRNVEVDCRNQASALSLQDAPRRAGERRLLLLTGPQGEEDTAHGLRGSHGIEGWHGLSGLRQADRPEPCQAVPPSAARRTRAHQSERSGPAPLCSGPATLLSSSITVHAEPRSAVVRSQVARLRRVWNGVFPVAAVARCGMQRRCRCLVS